MLRFFRGLRYCSLSQRWYQHADLFRFLCFCEEAENRARLKQSPAGFITTTALSFFSTLTTSSLPSLLSPHSYKKQKNPKYQAKEARKAASLLLLASARGYLDDIKALLSSDDAPLPTDGAVADKRRATPTHYAAAHNRVPVLRHLWSIGAELDAEDATGKTPLHYAVAGRAKEAVEFLVATAKAWPGAPDGTGDDTPLHLAARSGDVELARVFLKAVGGSSSELLKDKNKRGLTPLGEALLLPVSRSCSTASAAAVAAAAAGKDHGDKSPVSPSSSSQAISKEEVFAMADALFEASSSAGGGSAALLRQAENSPRGWPLLHVLGAAGSAEGVEWLLLRFEEAKRPCSIINERSSEATGSLAPLHAAALGGSAKVAELLIAAGAEVSSVDGAGRTPAEAFEAAFAAATKAAAASAAASAVASASSPSASLTPSAPPPLPLATAEEAKKLRSLLEGSSPPVPSSSSSSSAAKKGGVGDAPSSSATSSASVEAFSNSNPDSFSFSFESPAAAFKALPRAEQLATARKWSQLDGDDALEAATSALSPAAFDQARLARGMRHARAIAQVVASLHDDEDFQEAAKLRRVREAVAAVRRDPSSVARFQDDPKAMDVLLGLRKLQAVCAANGRHAVPFDELVVASGDRASKKGEDADRVAGLGKLHEDHVRAAVAAASEDDPKEAAAAAERALAESARGSAAAETATATAKAGGGARKPEPAAAGLLARAKAVLAAAGADADAAEAAAAAARGEIAGDGGSGSRRQPFDWSTFWRSLSKAMAASLLRAAVAFVVLWMVMKATSPPPATVAVPSASVSLSATEAEL